MIEFHATYTVVIMNSCMQVLCELATAVYVNLILEDISTLSVLQNILYNYILLPATYVSAHKAYELMAMD